MGTALLLEVIYRISIIHDILPLPIGWFDWFLVGGAGQKVTMCINIIENTTKIMRLKTIFQVIIFSQEESSSFWGFNLF